MSKWLLIVLCSLGLWCNAFAVELQPQHPDRYVVKAGDTLWDIAARFLKNPWDWTKVWQGNPGVVNPNYLYPGDVLVLEMQKGRPTVFVAKTLVGTTVRLSPKIRYVDDEQAIMTIPLTIIKPFLSRSRFVTAEEYGKAPYVVALDYQGRLNAAEYQDVYVRNLKTDDHITYSIYRKRQAFTDPKTEEIIGYQGEYIAEAKLTKFADPATFFITDSYRGLHTGDRLFVAEAILPPHFLPTAAPKGLEGAVIGVEDGVQQIGQFAVVTINLGSNAGVAPGYVFELRLLGRNVEDHFAADKQEQIQLPSRKIGELMVFKTYPRVSYALVMKATEPMQLGAQVVAPH